MTREDKRLARFGIYALLFAFGCLYFVGAAVIWLNPPNEYDKACLGKSLTEINECLIAASGAPVFSRAEVGDRRCIDMRDEAKKRGFRIWKCDTK